MALSFDTRTVALGELFSGTNTFRLPGFQRPFSWPEEKIAQLFDDIGSAYMHARVNSGGGSIEYFLGPIIVARRGQNAPYDLVDGQQRLASLSAILAVLRDELPEGRSRDAIQEHLVRPDNPVRGLSKSPRVALRDIDNDSFEKWVHTPEGTRRLPSQASTEAEIKSLEGLRRIREAYGTARSTFAEQLAGFILDHCHVILITADSVDEAYKLFRSVNTLGEPLTDADLARAELLGAEGLADQERDRLRQAWDSAEDELGLEDLRSYVETVADIVMPQLQDEVLLTKLRKIIADPRRIVPFRNRLGEFLISYVKLKSASLAFDGDASDINRVVRCLLALKNEEWVPLALLWLTNHHSGLETYRFFRALDALMHGMLVLGVTKSERAKRLNRIWQGILEGWVLSRAGSELFLKQHEINKLKAILEKPIAPNKAYLKPFLLRLNAEMTAPEFQPLFPDNLTLEHVLPQKPKPHSAWVQNFPEHIRRKQLSELIGNYALLTQKMNPQGSNSDFRRKKQIYFDFRDHQNFALTAQISQYDDWNEAVIFERQRMLMGLASNIFNPLLAPPA
ncbi:MAG: DUF262 domain-containing HNH endonuclease family protein [Rhodomicrobium sp.]